MTFPTFHRPTLLIFYEIDSYCISYFFLLQLQNEKASRNFWVQIENMQSSRLIEEKRVRKVSSSFTKNLTDNTLCFCNRIESNARSIYARSTFLISLQPVKETKL